MKKSSKKGVALRWISVGGLLAALLAPQFVGVFEAVKMAADQTDCAGLCSEEDTRE